MVILNCYSDYLRHVIFINNYLYNERYHCYLRQPMVFNADK
ncbi:hypothetical protein MGSAQ_000050 [marine sediment metagenome]|uniref:Uncharacterized protein n=1 Tax=marine sediment metagenome TaxID=412755 RepID=A0A1B6NYF4_9ZZZZ